MPGDKLSRRTFLQGSSALAIFALAEAASAARDENAAFEILTPYEARELDAVAARILPTTDTPGAREAGVIYFMDKALGSFMSDELESIRSGLAEFESGISGTFSELSEAGQDKYLRTRDCTHFFNRVRFMTIAGFFGMSSYGGNRGQIGWKLRDQIGWKLIGFDGHRGAWQPPFGYYDAEYMRGEHDGE
jgi:gluconate 2-dehydrogenase gamma chain